MASCESLASRIRASGHTVGSAAKLSGIKKRKELVAAGYPLSFFVLSCRGDRSLIGWSEDARAGVLVGKIR